METREKRVEREQESPSTREKDLGEREVGIEEDFGPHVPQRCTLFGRRAEAIRRVRWRDVDAWPSNGGIGAVESHGP